MARRKHYGSLSEFDAEVESPEPEPQLEVAPVESSDAGLSDLAKKVAQPVMAAGKPKQRVFVKGPKRILYRDGDTPSPEYLVSLGFVEEN
jgi:hypothetical protein